MARKSRVLTRLWDNPRLRDNFTVFLVKVSVDAPAWGTPYISSSIRFTLPYSDPKENGKRMEKDGKGSYCFSKLMIWDQSNPRCLSLVQKVLQYYFSGISLVYPVCHRMDPQSLGLTCSCWESTTCKCFLGDAVISGDFTWTTSDFHHFLVMSESKSNKKWGCNLPT